MLNSSVKKIALLGATGHIAKNLILGLCNSSQFELHLFARTRSKVVSFLVEFNILNSVKLVDFTELNHFNYDVIINCVGMGDPDELLKNPFRVFQVTEEYDNLVLSYLQNSNETLYINLSSGAAYGTDFSEPASNLKWSNVDVNNLTIKDYYGISKLNMEAKHRSLSKNHIVDLRVFSFFSCHIDLQSRFLLTDIIQCLMTGKILETSSDEIIRDYVHPKDLVNLVELCIDKHVINEVFDVYSRKPISKFELLDFFISNHGLKIDIKANEKVHSVTGSKSNYYSLNRNAQMIGYSPKYNSLQSVADGYNSLKMRKSNE
ncbi:NAD-dependent epimerase/dehydratase family protein [Paenibacillus sp. FSL K6-2524]|uniref:NAD-dependent epimerase/dehydratase family protein n=1 Tax=Paenibacillus sp. FSL K6-2524 TaxID=2954516 RepID=UPI0030F84BFD